MASLRGPNSLRNLSVSSLDIIFLRISVAMRHGGGLPFHPRAQQHINRPTRRLPLQ
jgi:hypothetical protein